MTQPTHAPRPPDALAERAREYQPQVDEIGISDGAYGGRLAEELLGKLAELAAELDRYQTAAVDPAVAALAPCDPPDIAGGESDCHIGDPWPCAATRAAWALRGWSADAMIADVLTRARRDVAVAAAELEADPAGCPVCGAPTGGDPCVRPPAGSPPGTSSCADLVAEAARPEMAT
jgi:hypothetical protein